MVKAKIKLKNPTGLHLRPAGILCNEAVKFDCSVQFQFRGTVSNAKSVLSVLGQLDSAWLERIHQKLFREMFRLMAVTAIVSPEFTRNNQSKTIIKNQNCAI